MDKEIEEIYLEVERLDKEIEEMDKEIERIHFQAGAACFGVASFYLMKK